jgi:phosphate transport system protein
MQKSDGRELRTLRDEAPRAGHTLDRMQQDIEPELDALKQRLLIMASHAEAAVNQALEALVTRDDKLALRVKENDHVLDRFEVEIDNLAIQILAQGPPPGDLRFVTVAMKISQNLERVGDEAAKIAKRARALSTEAPLKVNVDLPDMARLALGMLKAALDAFVNRDPTAARAIIPRDQEVDALNKEIHRALVRHMTQDSETIARCLNFMTVTKCLERIADHATNVAEAVVYLCEAHDIRHSGKILPESALLGTPSP